MANTINVLKPSVCFEVQKIIGISTGDGKSMIYQVQWAPSWISGVHLMGCEDLIEQFEYERKDKGRHHIKVEEVHYSQDGDGLMTDEMVNDEVMSVNITDNSPEERFIENSNQIICTNAVDPSIHTNDRMHLSPHLENTKHVDNNSNKNVNVRSLDSIIQNLSQDSSCRNTVHPDFQRVQREESDLENMCNATMENEENEETGHGATDTADSVGITVLVGDSTKDDKYIQTYKYFNEECRREDTFSSGHTLQDKNDMVDMQLKMFGLSRNRRGSTLFSREEIRKKKREKEKEKEKRNRFKLKRIYCCDTCGKTFKDNSTLVCHVRVHTGERPFECKVCNKKFKMNHHLKQHLQNRHP